jgi:hypothetical protein
MFNMRHILKAAVAACALVATACGDGRDPIDPTGPYTFSTSGTVHMLSGAVPAGLVASVSGTAGVTTAPVGADGRFTLQARVDTDSVDITVDVQAGGTRTVLPALFRVAGRQPAQSYRVVLVPNRWTIQGGTYAGTAVPISVDAAFRPPCSTPTDTNCDGFYPIEWLRGIVLWQSSMYPVRLAFDRTNSHQSISAADSIAFWNIVATMNADMGTQLFRPAQAGGLTFAADGRPNDTLVVVRADTTLDVGFAAWTSWWWNAADDIIGGVVRLRSASNVRSASLMTHELLHTLGFKHSCAWTTVMGGYGCSSAQRLTATDVAHAQVAHAVRDRQRAIGATHGLVAALQGERVVLLGLSRLPAAAAQRLAIPPADLLFQGDSVFHSDHVH